MTEVWVLIGALVLLGTLWRHRPGPRRLRSLVPARSGPNPFDPEVVGGRIRRLLGRPPSAAADRRLGVAVRTGAGVASAVLVLRRGAVLPALVLGVLGTLGSWVHQGVRARRAAQQRRAEVVRGLPELVDLLAVAVGAGLTLPLAIAGVAAWLRGPHGAAVQEVDRLLRLGTTRTEALQALVVELGEPARPLVAALRAAEHDGLPLGPALQRLGDDARARRRRQAETEARRTPVRLLFPLVLCTLPAFVLLTVVPLLVGSLSSLGPRPLR